MFLILLFEVRFLLCKIVFDFFPGLGGIVNLILLVIVMLDFDELLVSE